MSPPFSILEPLILSLGLGLGLDFKLDFLQVLFKA